MSSWAPTKYKTKNWSSYNDSLKRRGSLSIWFDAEMIWTPPPSGKRGRQRQFSDAAIQTCLTLKVLFGMPLRQTTGFVQSLLRLAGLDWVAPDFSTLCRRQKTLNVSLPYRGSKGPLNLLVDSTGIKAEGEGEWNARKHGGSKRRIWRKIHIGIDEETLEIRPSKSLAATLVTHPCYQNFCTKSHPIRTSAVSPQTGHMTLANATTRLLPEMHMLSSRHARTPSPGSRRVTVPLRATMQSIHNDIWAGPCGDAGVDITAEVASKPKCTA
jgi:hypothetical protein